MRKRYLHDTYGESDAFWDRTWDGDWKQKCSAPPPVMRGLVACMMKYLQPGMLLLEGGCGDARYVRYFTNLGVKTIGVDFAQNTVQRINEYLPNLGVRLGDIRDLKFSDGYFDAYYSGGVIEHFEDGVAPQLSEAHRVLKNGGYFFVTVPHMNLSRRIAAAVFPTRVKKDLDGRISFHKEKLRDFVDEESPRDFHFHEYVFSTSEMRAYLTTNGFTIDEEMCFSSASGLCDIEWYRSLVGIDRQHRTIMNKAFAIPLRCVRYLEETESHLGQILCKALGRALGNMKVYVCRAKK